MPEPKYRILVVDDEDDVRQALTDFLQRNMSVNVVAVSDGYQALEQIEWTPFDAILLDIGMPGISGREVLLKVREHLPKAVILVLTRWDSDVVAEEIASSGAEYIPKPYSLKHLKTVLETKLAEVK